MESVKLLQEEEEEDKVIIVLKRHRTMKAYRYS
jgi:hypothetical protein